MSLASGFGAMPTAVSSAPAAGVGSHPTGALMFAAAPPPTTASKPSQQMWAPQQQQQQQQRRNLGNRSCSPRLVARTVPPPPAVPSLGAAGRQGSAVASTGMLG